MRYADIISKIEGFEEWGKKRKMAVRARGLQNVETRKEEELADNGF